MTHTESFGRGRIAESILDTESVPFTLKVSKVPTEEDQFITINPDTNNEEIFFYTTKTGTIGEAGTLNITGRGYNVNNSTQDSGNQNDHDENSEYKLALNHIIINDKADLKTTNTFEENITMEGDLLFTTTDNLGLRINTLTTTERDLLTPANGYIIYNSTDGVNQQYISGAWNDVGNTGTPDATETVAGKVEIATQAELDAGTAIGGTGATLVAPVDKMYQGTTTARGLVTRATDAEVDTGTNDVKYVTPKGVKDNYGKAPSLTTGNLTISASGGTQVIAHGFGVKPGKITMYTGGSGKSIGLYIDETASEECIDDDGGTASAIARIEISGDYNTWTVTSLDATNVTLTRTVT